MQTLLRYPWWTASCLLAVVGLATVPPALALEDLPVTNLGSRYAALQNGWVAYTQSESLEGQDFNGDGDTQDQVVHVRELATGQTTNLGIAQRYYFDGLILGEWLVVPVFETSQGEDLNGDGDFEDDVVHVHHLPTGETTNLAFAGWLFFYLLSGLPADRFVFVVSESDQGEEDLNGDGDFEDDVAFVHDLSTGETTNLKVDGVRAATPDWLLFAVSEREQGEDLDSDGDIDDEVLHVRSLTTGETTNLGFTSTRWSISGDWLGVSVSEAGRGEDLNGDGDTFDEVIHVRNLSTGEARNLRLASLTNVWIQRDTLAFGVSEQDSHGEDLNGDGDTDDTVLHVHKLSEGETTNLGFTSSFAQVHGDWLVFEPKYNFFRVHNVSTGETTNLDIGLTRTMEFYWGFAGEWLVYSAPEPEGPIVHGYHLPTGETTSLGLEGYFMSGSGGRLLLAMSADPNSSDLVAHLVDARNLLKSGGQLPGDCNQDGALNVADAVCIFSVLFVGNVTAFPCGDGSPRHEANLALLDWQPDGSVNLSDGIRSLQHLFSGGSPHPLGTDCVPMAGCETTCMSR